MDKQYWLVKSEPEVFSIEDLRRRPGQREPWDGVRNYQARNFMRDQMQPGDAVLFYHSNCPVPSIVGLAEVASKPYPDPTAFDESSKYFDPKSDPDKPRWVLVDIRWKATFAKSVSLAMLKEDALLSQMQVARKGNRLSITPVTAQEFTRVCELARAQ